MNWLEEFREKWFPKTMPLTALDTYTITKYGLKLNRDTLYKKSIEEIASLMVAKSAKGSYSLVFDLDENIPELGEYLTEYYSNLGYNSFVLDHDVDSRIETPSLYISWKQRSSSSK